MRTQARRAGRGFTLAEMLIVAALIGILAAIALPNYRRAQLKARESALREDLWILRDLIDQYKADRGTYPEDLSDLEHKGYVRKIPLDPMTQEADWVEERDSPADEAPDEENVDTGVKGVHSAAEGTGVDGRAYSEW